MRLRKRWRTSSPLLTSGHTKTPFNEKLKVRLAHFYPAALPAATAGHDVTGVPSCPAARARVPPRTQRLQTHFLYPRRCPNIPDCS